MQFIFRGFVDIVKYLKSNVKPKDIIITLGAGNITKLGQMLLVSYNN